MQAHRACLEAGPEALRGIEGAGMRELRQHIAEEQALGEALLGAT